MDKKKDIPKRIWKEVIDPSSRSVYYWNVLTGDTTWENPDPEDKCTLSFKEKVSHDSRVIVDKLVNKVDRIKFFFDEISLINEVCDHVRSQDNSSLMELIDLSLTNLGKILDIATPKTKTYNKYMDLKKFFSEQKSYLKNNGYLSDDVLENITDESYQIERNLKDITRFTSRSEELLNDYKVYVEKKKLELKPEESPEKPPENIKYHSHDSNKKDKNSRLKSIHDRWNRASEIIDESENYPETVKKHKPTFSSTDKDNPNLVPITKPWYENKD